MKKGVIFLMMTAVLAAANSHNAIELQPGPVEGKQGYNVSLWCKLKHYADYNTKIPVEWQSPPTFKTRTKNCDSHEMEKYVISCAESPFMWYNLTIKNVQWADKGKYRCLHGQQMNVVDLKVLVPVTDVEMTLKSNSTVIKDVPMTLNSKSMEYQSLLLSPNITVELTCTTNCAYPAPTISWFENDQPFKGNATISKTEGCTGEKQGQKRTTSTVTVTAKYVDQEREESIIFCMANNIIREPDVSAVIHIIYNVTPSPPQPVIAAGVNILIIVGVTVLVGMLALDVLVVLIVLYRKQITNKLGNIRRNRRGDKEKGTGNDISEDLPGQCEPLLPPGDGTASNQQDTVAPVSFRQDPPGQCEPLIPPGDGKASNQQYTVVPVSVRQDPPSPELIFPVGMTSNHQGTGARVLVRQDVPDYPLEVKMTVEKGDPDSQQDNSARPDVTDGRELYTSDTSTLLTAMPWTDSQTTNSTSNEVENSGPDSRPQQQHVTHKRCSSKQSSKSRQRRKNPRFKTTLIVPAYEHSNDEDDTDGGDMYTSDTATPGTPGSQTTNSSSDKVENSRPDSWPQQHLAHKHGLTRQSSKVDKGGRTPDLEPLLHFPKGASEEDDNTES